MSATATAERASAIPLLKRSSLSYSRLTTFDKCSKLYDHTYVNKKTDIRQDTVATRFGTFCHTALEDFYGPENDDGHIETPYQALIREGGAWDKELGKYKLQDLVPDLQAYAAHMTGLYYRASAAYTGPDAIRKKPAKVGMVGDVSTAPEMTSAWKDHMKKHGLYALAARIDATARQAAPKRWGRDVPLSETYALSLGVMYPYKHPKEIASIVEIELPISEIRYAAADTEGKLLRDENGQMISTARNRGVLDVYEDPETGKPIVLDVLNPLPMPTLNEDGTIAKDENGAPIWSTTTLFGGYIDLVARNAKGELMVVDHKSSKEKPTRDKVVRHEQLLAYGWALYHLTGLEPKWIGINWLRGSELILAPFSLEKAEAAMARLTQVWAGIQAGHFIARDPYGFGSPCMRKDFKTQTDILCPGMKYCHPDVYLKYHPEPAEDDFSDSDDNAPTLGGNRATDFVDDPFA